MNVLFVLFLASKVNLLCAEEAEWREVLCVPACGARLGQQAREERRETRLASAEVGSRCSWPNLHSFSPSFLSLFPGRLMLLL